MLQFSSMLEALPVFKALGAESRVQIMELLYREGDKNLNELAFRLGMTNSAISPVSYTHLPLLQKMEGP